MRGPQVRFCERRGGAIHCAYSTRTTMAKAVGISPSSVGRIWREAGLKPHLVKTFKVSNDPKFEEKVADVVGLYMNPPDKAMVLCVDEKSQIQALDRTQPGLPLKKGRAATMTHDYKRNGTTTLFAALDVKSGMVIGECLPRHRAEEFIKFLKKIDRTVAKEITLHLILDNYATHKTAEVKAWLENISASKYTLFRRRHRGSTLSNASSQTSQANVSGAAPSTAWQSWERQSAITWKSTMQPQSLTSGPKAQARSLTSNAAPAKNWKLSNLGSKRWIQNTSYLKAA